VVGPGIDRDDRSRHWDQDGLSDLLLRLLHSKLGGLVAPAPIQPATLTDEQGMMGPCGNLNHLFNSLFVAMEHNWRELSELFGIEEAVGSELPRFVGPARKYFSGSCCLIES